MKKSTLFKKIAKQVEQNFKHKKISEREVRIIIYSFIKEMRDALLSKENTKISFRELGTFKSVVRKKRTIKIKKNINDKNSEMIEKNIPAKLVIKFKPNKHSKKTI